MNKFEDFLIDTFDDVEEVEKKVYIGGRERIIKLRPIGAVLGDEIRKRCKTTKIYKGQKIVESNQEKFMDNLIVETITYPDFKSAELQSAWGVMGAVELLHAMKSKMRDGEYAELGQLVSSINGYDKGMEEIIEEAKN